MNMDNWIWIIWMVDGLIYLKNIYLYIESPSHFLAGYLRVSRQLRHAPDPPWSMVVVRYKEVMFQWWLFFLYRLQASYFWGISRIDWISWYLKIWRPSGMWRNFSNERGNMQVDFVAGDVWFFFSCFWLMVRLNTGWVQKLMIRKSCTSGGDDFPTEVSMGFQWDSMC